jgi:hypothetical protein
MICVVERVCIQIRAQKFGRRHRVVDFYVGCVTYTFAPQSLFHVPNVKMRQV